MVPHPAIPSISIVVPNARAFPAGLVHGLVARLREDDEVIVVRNHPTGGRRRWTGLAGSPPIPPAESGDSPPPPHSALPLVSDTLVLLDSPPGAAAARNVGWRTARHRWVLFLDDDVDVPGSFLDTVRSRMIDEHAHGVTTFRVRSEEGSWSALIGRTISLDRGGEKLRSAGAPLVLAETWRYGVGAAMLVRRDILEDTGGFKEKLGAGRKHGGGEDLEFLWHASRHTAIQYLGDIAVDHRDVDDLTDVGRKFCHYGRAIARLSGTSKERHGLDAVAGYCIHIASAVVGCGQLTEHGFRERCVLRIHALVAVIETGRVYVGSLLLHPRTDVLCEDCLVT
jgi:Glycosyl transferase family 21